MASYRDSDQRVLMMLGAPDGDYPSPEMRFEWALMFVDTLAKEITRSGKPSLIDHFTISVSASETEKVIPRDDVEALFHAYDSTTNRPIYVINVADAERWGVAGPPNTTGTGIVQAIGLRGIGDQRRLVIYPPGASGELTIYYLREINQGPSPADTVDLLDGFHLVLVPAHVALYGMELWKWSHRSEEDQARIRAGFLNPNNPASLVRLFAEQRNLFIERIYAPAVLHTTNNLVSPMARHRRGRGFGGINPWGG